MNTDKTNAMDPKKLNEDFQTERIIPESDPALRDEMIRYNDEETELMMAEPSKEDLEKKTGRRELSKEEKETLSAIRETIEQKTNC